MTLDKIFLFPETGARIDGLAFEPESRLLYYTDMARNFIGVTTPTGSYHKILVRGNMTQLRALVLDPDHGCVPSSPFHFYSPLTLFVTAYCPLTFLKYKRLGFQVHVFWVPKQNRKSRHGWIGQKSDCWQRQLAQWHCDRQEKYVCPGFFPMFNSLLCAQCVFCQDNMSLHGPTQEILISYSLQPRS